MNFVSSIKHSFQHSFDYKTRATRSEFWWFALFSILVFAVYGLLVYLVLTISPETIFSGFGQFLISYLPAVLALPLVVAAIPLNVRRLHDVGWTGWFILITGVPLIGAIFQLIYSLKDSQTSPNQWGSCPK